MENYKVKVNNEAESKEVQELFFELGFGWHYGDIKELKHLGKPCIYSYAESKDITFGSTGFAFNKHGNKELTIPQLRDLVVLKRNDVGDRNVVDPEYSDANLYLDSDSNLFVFNIPTQKWKESNLNGEEDVLQRLKPIEREMKEYLEPMPNGDYRYHKDDGFSIGGDWIEVPEGAEKATFCNNFLIFWKGGKYSFSVNEEAKWCYKVNNDSIYFDFDEYIKTYSDSYVVWQRRTQPEELPFIDDEPKCDNPLLIQVGGNHYKNLAIQPVEFAMKNNLDYCQANAIKYIVRHANKNGKQDLEKAKHYIDLLIQNYYSEDI